MSLATTRTWIGALGLSLSAYTTLALAELPQTQPFQTLHPNQGDLIEIEDGRPQFGAVIAVRNDTALVGMPTFAGGGRVALFTRTDTVWNRTGYLPCPRDGAGCHFVHSIALRGNIAVVGAENFLLVFRRVDGKWSLTQRINSPDPEALQFGGGGSVRYLDGLITAIAYHPEEPSALYVFEISSAGKLLHTTRLMASDGRGANGFGVSASMALDTIVVGAPDAGRTPDQPPIGAAYVFRRQGTQWVERTKLVPAGGERHGAFGNTVAIDRGLILVGAPDAARAGGDNSGFQAGGYVYAFERKDGVWTQSAKLRPSIDEHSRYTDFGQDIVMFGERAVISARDTETDSIVVFEYERTAQGLKATSLARGTSGGGLALFQNILMLGSPLESHDSAVGHVRVFNMRLPIN